MAKVVRRQQTRKVQTARSKKTRDYRNGNDFPAMKGPKYTRKAKYVIEY